MKVGTFNATHLGSVDAAVAWSQAAAGAGFDTVWFPASSDATMIS